MKKLILILVLIVFSTDTYSQKSYSLEEGLKLAKAQNKKILIYINKGSEKWCNRMEKEVYSNSAVKNYVESNFIYVKVDLDSDGSFNYNDKVYNSKSLQKHFGVTGYPTHIFLNPKGELILFKYNNEDAKNFSGFIGHDEFERLLKYIIDDKYRLDDLTTVL